MFIAGPIKHIVSWSGVSGLKVGGHVQSERVQPASRVCRWFYLMGDVTPLPASVSLECEDGCRPIRASDTAARTHARTHTSAYFSFLFGGFSLAATSTEPSFITQDSAEVQVRFMPSRNKPTTNFLSILGIQQAKSSDQEIKQTMLGKVSVRLHFPDSIMMC